MATVRLSAPSCAALGSSTPVPGTIRPSPNRPFMVKLQATAELQRSATTKPAVKGLEIAGTAVAAFSAAGACWRRLTPVIRVSTCRSEEHTSELQSLMRISYAVFCLKNKTQKDYITKI